MNFYRFSISWARILPDGDISNVNTDGVQYYNKLIDELINNDIQPMITMYHYDLPQFIQQIGGLTNPIFVRYFKEYARLLYVHFGSRVKHWITFNEPVDFCIEGYGTGIAAPQMPASGVGEYLCIDNVLKAHAAAYQVYNTEFRKKFGGKIGITLSSRFFYAKDNDTDVVDRAMQFQVRLFTVFIMIHYKRNNVACFFFHYSTIFA